MQAGTRVPSVIYSRAIGTLHQIGLAIAKFQRDSCSSCFSRCSSCFSRRRNCSFSFRNCSISWRAPRHRSRSEATRCFHSRRAAIGSKAMTSYSHTFATYRNQVRRICPALCSIPNLIDHLSGRHIAGGPIFEGSDAVNNDWEFLARIEGMLPYI